MHHYTLRKFQENVAAMVAQFAMLDQVNSQLCDSMIDSPEMADDFFMAASALVAAGGDRSTVRMMPDSVWTIVHGCAMVGILKMCEVLALRIESRLEAGDAD